MILYEYNFINHLLEELEMIKDLNKDISYYNLKKMILISLKECKKHDNKKPNCYKFYMNGRMQWINEDEFWEIWNKNLYEILQGDL